MTMVGRGYEIARSNLAFRFSIHQILFAGTEIGLSKKRGLLSEWVKIKSFENVMPLSFGVYAH